MVVASDSRHARAVRRACSFSRVLVLGVLVAGCDDAPMAITDGGFVDAAPATDTGPVSDTGSASDTGWVSDAGSASDAGSVSVTDAGTEPDALAPPDAFMVPDAFVPPDAFLPADAGTPPRADLHVHIEVDNTCRMTVTPREVSVPPDQTLYIDWHNHSRDYPVDVWMSYGGGYTDLATGATWDEPIGHCGTPFVGDEYADISTACSSFRFLIHCR